MHERVWLSKKILKLPIVSEVWILEFKIEGMFPQEICLCLMFRWFTNWQIWGSCRIWENMHIWTKTQDMTCTFGPMPRTQMTAESAFWTLMMMSLVWGKSALRDLWFPVLERLASLEIVPARGNHYQSHQNRPKSTKTTPTRQIGLTVEKIND